jgi:hypothetical protein
MNIYSHCIFQLECVSILLHTSRWEYGKPSRATRDSVNVGNVACVLSTVSEGHIFQYNVHACTPRNKNSYVSSVDDAKPVPLRHGG